MKQLNQTGLSEADEIRIVSAIKDAMKWVAVAAIILFAGPAISFGVFHYQTALFADRFEQVINGYSSVSDEHRFPGRSDSQTAVFCSFTKEWAEIVGRETDFNYRDLRSCYDTSKNDFGRFDDPESNIDISKWGEHRFIDVNRFLEPRYEIKLQNPSPQSNKNPQKIYRDPL